MYVKYRAVKSAFIIGLILISIYAVFTPTTSAGIIFDLQNNVKVSWNASETEKPILPNMRNSIDLEINYIVTRGYFGRRILVAYSGRIAYVYLSIIECSPWIEAYLETDTIPMRITDQKQPAGHAILTYQGFEDIPAYTNGYIIIRAYVRRIGLISRFEQAFTINIVSGYNPSIKYSLPRGNHYTISPFKLVSIPIKLSNHGNAKTMVDVEVENTSDSFDISVDDITLGYPDGNETAYLTITADNDFDEEKVTLKITPYSTDNPIEKGETALLNLFISNDGSHREFKFPIDLNTIILILTIIILILLATIIPIAIVKRLRK
jgi:hypothetical protein